MKKGFTLIELIAALIILSIVAVIVTPNIYSSITDYREQLYETQLTSIETATKNWIADNVDSENVLNENEFRTYVSLNDLELKNYIDPDLKNPKTNKEFGNLTFTIITCKIIKGDEFNADNYKYSYKVMDNTKKYIEYLAELWLKDNSSTLDYSSITVDEETLLTTISKNQILVKVNDLYKYVNPNLIEENTNSIKDIETSQLVNNFNVNIYAIKKGTSYTYRYEGIVG